MADITREQLAAMSPADRMQAMLTGVKLVDAPVIKTPEAPDRVSYEFDERGEIVKLTRLEFEKLPVRRQAEIGRLLRVVTADD
jgi:hypothetical protein